MPNAAGRAWRHGEAWVAALVLALASVVFLWEPLTSGGIYAPGDLTQDTGLLRVAPADYRTGNPELTDPAVQYLPWLDWNRSELAEGRLPLWNPYNASGSPHLANGQSAVFSVFSVPYYVLSLRWAPVVAAFMQLMAGGMLTYGLLRHLRASFLAGVVGGLGFAFCAASVLWLPWPLSDAAVLIPGTIWAASALVTSREPDRRCLAAAALAGIVALGVFAGHIETTFVGAVLAGGVAVIRIARRHRHQPREALRPSLWLLGAGTLGAVVASVALLPLLEYVRNSSATGFRAEQEVLARYPLALHVFPLVAGTPGQRFTGDAPAGGVTLTDQAGLYVGGTVLVLAVVGAVWAGWRRRPVAAFFAAVGLLVLMAVYDVAGVGTLVAGLPVFELVMVSRLVVVWQLCVVVLAAFGVDAVVRAGRVLASRPGRDRTLALGTLATGGAAFVAAGVWLARGVRNQHLRTDGAIGDRALAASNGHIGLVVASLAVGVLGMALLVARPGRRMTALAGGVVVGAVALQGPVLLRDVNPTVDPAYVFPESDALRAVSQVTGDDQTLWLGDASLFPDMNLRYRLSSPATYDALVVESYDELYRGALRPPRIVWQGIPLGLLDGPVDPRGAGNLRALGIRYVVAGPDYPFGEPVARGRPLSAPENPDRATTFVLDGDGHAIETVVADGTGTRESGPCRLTIEDGSGAPLRSSETACIDGTGVFSFPELPTASGQQLAVTVAPTDPPADGHAAAPATGAARTAPTAPSLSAYSTPVPGLELAAVVEDFRVYRVPGTPPRYFSPASVTDDVEERSAVFDPDFDPLRTSVVHGSSTDAADPADASKIGTRPGTVEVLDETPTSVRLRVDRTTPGWLLAFQTRYPGWHARVDGSPTPISTANHAFMGVPVPAGTAEVELTYDPTAVRVGTVLTLAGSAALAGLLALGCHQRRRRARRNAAGVPMSPTAHTALRRQVVDPLGDLVAEPVGAGAAEDRADP